MVVLEVSDEGPGVPEGLVAHVFDRGVSTASSTGIGLGLARAFIEADGGRLELRRAVPPIFAIFLAVGQPPAVVGSEPSESTDGQPSPAGPATKEGSSTTNGSASGDGSPGTAPATAASPVGR
jgi:signal transduction histidine kinase